MFKGSLTSDLNKVQVAERGCHAQKSRPTPVTFAGLLHFLVASAFLSIPLLGLVYGAQVQAAAEAEVARQGAPATVLSDNGLSFAETGVALAIPIAVALGLTALGIAVLAGRRWARTVAWIVMPLVLLGNLAIMASQATAGQAVQTAFGQSGDERLRRLDAQRLLDAATAAYPDWITYLTGIRNVLVIAGAIVAVILLVLPAARAYFRGEPGFRGEPSFRGDLGLPGGPGSRGEPGSGGEPGSDGGPGLCGEPDVRGEPGSRGEPGEANLMTGRSG